MFFSANARFLPIIWDDSCHCWSKTYNVSMQFFRKCSIGDSLSMESQLKRIPWWFHHSTAKIAAVPFSPYLPKLFLLSPLPTRFLFCKTMSTTILKKSGGNSENGINSAILKLLSFLFLLQVAKCCLKFEMIYEAIDLPLFFFSHPIWAIFRITQTLLLFYFHCCSDIKLHYILQQRMLQWIYTNVKELLEQVLWKFCSNSQQSMRRS